ncbi:MAG: 3-keto-disaccharide hydrolase [Paludibacteraceae bacterium]
MKKIKFLLFLLAVVLFTSGCKSKEWISLFNGNDLTGWTVKMKGYDVGENFGNTFRVEDGILKVRYDQYNTFDNRFAHIFYKDKFSNYIVRFEYRFVGEQCSGAPAWGYKNSGILIHGQTPESMNKDQDFPVSIEVQLLGGDSTGERPTGNVCTPGTNIVINNQLILEHCTNSSSKTYRGNEWVKAEVEVHGNKIIKHIINGDTVMVYSQPQLDPRDPDYEKLLILNGGNIMLSEGTICLQSESHPCDFRNVKIKILKE